MLVALEHQGRVASLAVLRDTQVDALHACQQGSLEIARALARAAQGALGLASLQQLGHLLRGYLKLHDCPICLTKPPKYSLMSSIGCWCTGAHSRLVPKEESMSKVLIAGEDLQFTPVPDPVPEPLTGELIAKLAGADAPEDLIVIQWLKDGNLETLRLNEKAQSDGGSDLRFIVFRSSSTYLFEVDNHRFEWGAGRIRGDVIKKLIDVDPVQYGVWQQSNDGEDKPIDNDKFAELQDRGLEVFFTARRESTEGIKP